MDNNQPSTEPPPPSRPLSRSERLDLLTMQRPTTVSKLEDRLKKPNNPMPPNPLPKWKRLPLDKKFPSIPSRRGQFPYSAGRLGSSRFDVPCGQPFDTRDPHIRQTPIKYEALHDPCLRDYFNSRPNTVELLIRQGLLTCDGTRVVTPLPDYNLYRAYLSRLNRNILCAEIARNDAIEEANREQLRAIIDKWTRELNALKAEEVAARKRPLAEREAMYRLRRDLVREMTLQRGDEIRRQEDVTRRQIIAGDYYRDIYNNSVRFSNQLCRALEYEREKEDFVTRKREFQREKLRYEQALLEKQKLLELKCADRRRDYEYWDNRPCLMELPVCPPRPRTTCGGGEERPSAVPAAEARPRTSSGSRQGKPVKKVLRRSRGVGTDGRGGSDLTPNPFGDGRGQGVTPAPAAAPQPELTSQGVNTDTEDQDLERSPSAFLIPKSLRQTFKRVSGGDDKLQNLLEDKPSDEGGKVPIHHWHDIYAPPEEEEESEEQEDLPPPTPSKVDIQEPKKKKAERKIKRGKSGPPKTTSGDGKGSQSEKDLHTTTPSKSETNLQAKTPSKSEKNLQSKTPSSISTKPSLAAQHTESRPSRMDQGGQTDHIPTSEGGGQTVPIPTADIGTPSGSKDSLRDAEPHDSKSKSSLAKGLSSHQSVGGGSHDGGPGVGKAKSIHDAHGPSDTKGLRPSHDDKGTGVPDKKVSSRSVGTEHPKKTSGDGKGPHSEKDLQAKTPSSHSTTKPSLAQHSEARPSQMDDGGQTANIPTSEEGAQTLPIPTADVGTTPGSKGSLRDTEPHETKSKSSLAKGPSSQGVGVGTPDGGPGVGKATSAQDVGPSDIKGLRPSHDDKGTGSQAETSGVDDGGQTAHIPTSEGGAQTVPVRTTDVATPSMSEGSLRDTEPHASKPSGVPTKPDLDQQTETEPRPSQMDEGAQTANVPTSEEGGRKIPIPTEDAGTGTPSMSEGSRKDTESHESKPSLAKGSSPHQEVGVGTEDRGPGVGKATSAQDVGPSDIKGLRPSHDEKGTGLQTEPSRMDDGGQTADIPTSEEGGNTAPIPTTDVGTTSMSDASLRDTEPQGSKTEPSLAEGPTSQGVGVAGKPSGDPTKPSLAQQSESSPSRMDEGKGRPSRLDEGGQTPHIPTSDEGGQTGSIPTSEDGIHTVPSGTADVGVPTMSEASLRDTEPQESQGQPLSLATQPLLAQQTEPRPSQMDERGQTARTPTSDDVGQTVPISTKDAGTPSMSEEPQGSKTEPQESKGKPSSVATRPSLSQQTETRPSQINDGGQTANIPASEVGGPTLPTATADVGVPSMSEASLRDTEPQESKDKQPSLAKGPTSEGVGVATQDGEPGVGKGTSAQDVGGPSDTKGLQPSHDEKGTGSKAEGRPSRMDEGGQTPHIPTSEEGGQTGSIPTSDEGGQTGSIPTSEQGGQAGSIPTSEEGGQTGPVPTSEQGGQTGSIPTSEEGGQTGPVPTSEEGGQTGPIPTSDEGGQTGPIPTSDERGQTGPIPTSEEGGQTVPIPTPEAWSPSGSEVSLRDSEPQESESKPGSVPTEPSMAQQTEPRPSQMDEGGQTAQTPTSEEGGQTVPSAKADVGTPSMSEGSPGDTEPQESKGEPSSVPTEPSLAQQTEPRPSQINEGGQTTDIPISQEGADTVPSTAGDDGTPSMSETEPLESQSTPSDVQAKPSLAQQTEPSPSGIDEGGQTADIPTSEEAGDTVPTATADAGTASMSEGTEPDDGKPSLAEGSSPQPKGDVGTQDGGPGVGEGPSGQDVPSDTQGLRPSHGEEGTGVQTEPSLMDDGGQTAEVPTSEDGGQTVPSDTTDVGVPTMSEASLRDTEPQEIQGEPSLAEGPTSQGVGDEATEDGGPDGKVTFNPDVQRQSDITGLRPSQIEEGTGLQAEGRPSQMDEGGQTAVIPTSEEGGQTGPIPTADEWSPSGSEVSLRDTEPHDGKPSLAQGSSPQQDVGVGTQDGGPGVGEGPSGQDVPTDTQGLGPSYDEEGTNLLSTAASVVHQVLCDVAGEGQPDITQFVDNVIAEQVALATASTGDIPPLPCSDVSRTSSNLVQSVLCDALLHPSEDNNGRGQPGRGSRGGGGSGSGATKPRRKSSFTKSQQAQAQGTPGRDPDVSWVDNVLQDAHRRSQTQTECIPDVGVRLDPHSRMSSSLVHQVLCDLEGEGQGDVAQLVDNVIAEQFVLVEEEEKRALRGRLTMEGDCAPVQSLSRTASLLTNQLLCECENEGLGGGGQQPSGMSMGSCLSGDGLSSRFLDPEEDGISEIRSAVRMELNGLREAIQSLRRDLINQGIVRHEDD